MNCQQILELALKYKGRPAHLARIRLYASISGRYNAQMPQLSSELAALSGLDREQFEQECLHQSHVWTDKIAQASRMIQESEWMRKWLRSAALSYEPASGFEPEAQSLMSWMLSEALQNASTVLFKNCLKQQYIDLLTDLLDSKEWLGSAMEQIEQPVMEAALKKLSPTSEEYIEQSLVIVHILSSCLLFVLSGHTIPLVPARRFLKHSANWSPEQRAAFCGLTGSF